MSELPPLAEFLRWLAETPPVFTDAPVGAARVVGEEHPAQWGGLVDHDGGSDAAMAAHLLSTGEDQVALRAGTCSGSESPERVASPGWVAATSVQTVLRRRHSSHSGGAGACRDMGSPLPKSSQIMTRRPASP